MESDFDHANVTEDELQPEVVPDSDLAHVPEDELQPEVVPDSDLAHVPEDELQPEVVPDFNLAHVPEDELQPEVVPDFNLANVSKDELQPVVVPMQLDPKDGPCTVDRALKVNDSITASPYFSPEVDMVEIRADSIYHLTHKDVETLLGHNDARNILFTLRSVNEGGVKQWFNPDELQDWKAYERARADFYQQALELGAHAIDIELSNLQREEAGDIWKHVYEKLREKGNVVDEDTDYNPHHILVPSVHNFDRTPGENDLRMMIDGTRQLQSAQNLKYVVLKLAMMITCEDDMNRLASIAELGGDGGPGMVVVGLAKTKETEEFAFATRKEFPYKHKTVWTYAALEKPNAPGQISLKEVREYQVEQGSAD